MRQGDRISILNWAFVLLAFVIVGYAFSSTLDSQTGNRELDITLNTPPIGTEVIEQGTRPSISQTASDLSTQDTSASVGYIEKTAPLPVQLMPVQTSQEGPGTTDVFVSRGVTSTTAQEEIDAPVTPTRQPAISRNSARSRTPARTARSSTPARTARSRTPTRRDVNPPVARSFGQIRQLNPSTIPPGLGEDF